ncbi:glycosyltransferase [Chloroflexota bacterium]
MKILQVIHFFSRPHGAGSVQSAWDLSYEWIKMGHEVSIYTTDFELDQEYIDSLPDAKIHTFPNWTNSASFTMAPGMMRRLNKEIRYFDIVHIHNYRAFHESMVHHYATKYGVPYVLQARGSIPRIMGKEFLKKIYDNLIGFRVLRDASKLIAHNQLEATQYRSVGVNPAKIEVVPVGIDLQPFEHLPERGEFRRKYSIQPEEKIVLFLARLHKIKSPDLLVNSFARLTETIDNARLVFVGADDGCLDATRQLAKELNITDRVLFTGPLYNRDKIEAYTDADVYVLPSLYDMLPRTVLEACACGTPVIITEHCGLADWVHQQVGYTVPHDEDKLKEALFTILTDENLSRQFSENAKKLVRDFAGDVIADRIINIYEDVIKSTK